MVGGVGAPLQLARRGGRLGYGGLGAGKRKEEIEHADA